MSDKPWKQWSRDRLEQEYEEQCKLLEEITKEAISLATTVKYKFGLILSEKSEDFLSKLHYDDSKPTL